MMELAEAVLRGERRALARLLTVVENQSALAGDALAALFPHTGRGWIIGVTGAPGTGKSSLVNALAKAYRAQDKTVAILAVDPTSPFSGGAILGDRIRMRDLSGDKGVFIRSMATRGSLGGLARAARDAVRVMDAAGFDIILIETVGAGQSEVDIARAAQTTLVVEAPGMGDDVQAIKAGILEIADVLVVNKADRPGTDNTVRGLKTMLELGHPTSREHMTSHHGRLLPTEKVAAPATDFWIPPIVRTVATDEQGIDELIEAIASHRLYLADHLRDVEQAQAEVELYGRLREALMARLLDCVPADAFTDVIQRVASRQVNPAEAVNEILSLQEMRLGKIE